MIHGSFDDEHSWRAVVDDSLFLNCHERLLSAIRRRIGGSEGIDAEAILSETYIRYIVREDKFVWDESPRTVGGMERIARHIAEGLIKDEYRKLRTDKHGKNAIIPLKEHEPESDDTTPTQRAKHADLERRLREELSTRELLVVHRGEDGFAASEIADELDITTAAVRSIKRRVRDRLRELGLDPRRGSGERPKGVVDEERSRE